MKYYVYTPADGNEDGAFLGLTLDAAKDLARWHSRELRDCGCDNTAALVNTVGDCTTVWSCDGDSCNS